MCDIIIIFKGQKSYLIFLLLADAIKYTLTRVNKYLFAFRTFNKTVLEYHASESFSYSNIPFTDIYSQHQRTRKRFNFTKVKQQKV